ncbi:MAG: VWA domain-containing protein [Acidobacteria bacterium]|nr:VWA domain-containing protein [Acidobacteriota bacterium]
MLLACCCSFASGQEQTDEVVRVRTDLVQTDVMVFDKSGRFVDGLQREQFELLVDGKAQAISFFEQVRAGSAREQSPLGGKQAAPSSAADNPGRTLIFFIDDLHLSPDSIARTRSMLTEFVEHEMNDGDQVLLASTSGDIGFLQQFTESRTMLGAAIKRLVHKPYNSGDMTRESAPMTEYAALAIERKEDPRILKYYVEECQKGAPFGYSTTSCEIETINRARLILLQAAEVTASTYGALEKLMRAAAQVPGRKLAFFVSDGFLLDTGPRNADPRGRLNRIIDAALRAGIVLYTIDASGLRNGQLDATNNVAMDANGRLAGVALREIPARQDALNALAADTGGRALRNRSTFGPWVKEVLAETSSYYRLAWRPENEEQTSRDFKSITARIIGRPDLTVRLPRGFLKAESAAAKSVVKTPPAKSPPEQLREALASPAPRREIPTELSTIYLDTPEHGMVLTAAVELGGALAYEAVDGKQVAEVDVVGLVFDDKGKAAGNFQTHLKFNAPTATAVTGAASEQKVFYNHRFQLQPGLYQVLVAARDSRSGLLGSARQWVEIPNLNARKLSLSSLIVGLQNAEGTTEQAQFSVDHHFTRDAPLRYVVFIYNAKGATQPDVQMQAQVLRAGTQVLTTPWNKVPIAGRDPSRLAYGGELSLRSLAAGTYVLQVTARDQLAGTTAVQQTKITIE